MKLTDSILYSYTKPKHRKFEQNKCIKEIAAFFLGILTIESRFLKYDEIGEGYWIVRFEEFITNYLNLELNGFEKYASEQPHLAYCE